MRIIFEGGEADEHRLEAYEGIKSIDGLVRVARIATHYAATGEVRFRAPYTDQLEVHLTVTQAGSFELLFEQISNMGEGAQQAKAKANALIDRILRRGTGQAEYEPLAINGENIPPGDIEAMVEASEGGIKSAHRWISSGQKTIRVNDNERGVDLDIDTRNYVETTDIGQEITRDVSVAALNVNNRTGRVYLHDEGRTVAFLVHRNAENRTITNLSSYLDEYAHKTGATVNIRYRPVTHLDGRVTRLIIFDCFDIQDAA
jgi:hypothetical protein